MQPHNAASLLFRASRHLLRTDYSPFVGAWLEDSSGMAFDTLRENFWKIVNESGLRTSLRLHNMDSKMLPEYVSFDGYDNATT